MKTLPREVKATLTPKTIFAELSRLVIGQEKAKRTVAIAAYNHLKRIHALQHHTEKKSPELLKKSNILLIGPTGCGKTHLARVLAKTLELPLVIIDATEYTEAGYYGKDVEVMVSELLHKSNMDVSLAQKGIIFIDEIDKIARATHGARTGSADRDIGGEGVQQALLKILEGREIFVPLHPTHSWNKQEYVSVDTSNILFICAGTFSDLFQYSKKKKMGFAEAQAAGKPAKKTAPAKRPKLNLKDLHRFGMLEEFLGRLPVVVELQELNRQELLTVLRDTPDSMVKEYQYLMALDEVTLHFTEGALEAIVDFSISRGLGARGLRSIMEEVMHEFLFSAPEQKGKSITVKEEFVQEKLEAFGGES